MGCGTSFVKYVLFFFNLLIALFGLAMIGIGAAFLLNWAEITKVVQDNNIAVAPWLFIVVGSIVFIIAFFGCCGAIRESHCMVVTYAVFLVVIIILQVALAVLLYMYQDNVKDSIGKLVDRMFEKRDVFENLQTQFQCCGKYGPTDYGVLNFASLPSSCCPTGNSVCTAVNSYTEGCGPVLSRLWEKWGKIFAGITIGAACIEVVVTLFALFLANSIRNMDRRSRY